MVVSLLSELGYGDGWNGWILVLANPGKLEVLFALNY